MIIADVLEQTDLYHEDHPLHFLVLDEEDYYEPPSYNKPGNLIVLCEGDEFTVLEYDGDSAVFWINEGVGFDYWLKHEACITEPGIYIFEGITGEYNCGYFGDDDSVYWQWESLYKISIIEAVQILWSAHKAMEKL